MTAKSKTKARRNDLVAALKAKGLALREDSSLCRAYIYDGRGDLASVVDKMVEMAFLHTKTDYQTILDGLVAYELQQLDWMPREAILSCRSALVSQARDKAKAQAMERINKGFVKGELLCDLCDQRLTKSTAWYNWRGFGPCCESCINKDPDLCGLKCELDD